MNMASPLLEAPHGCGGGGVLVAAKRNLMHVLQSRDARPAWRPAGGTPRQPQPAARVACERARPPAPPARATHVTLAQLLSGGSGSGQLAGRQPGAGEKRGRESAAGSAAASGAKSVMLLSVLTGTFSSACAAQALQRPACIPAPAGQVGCIPKPLC